VLKKILSTSPISIDTGLVVIRLMAGAVLAIHGWAKMQNIDPFVDTVKSIQIPLPETMAWVAAASEFFGGIFLAGGLLTRVAALFVMGTMGVAVFQAHAKDPFVSTNNRQFAAVLLATAAGIFLTGPGRFALDTLIAGSGGGGGSKAK
jgi:putative oxidoreductase